MPGSAIKRDLGPRFEAGGVQAESKMAAAPQTRDTASGGMPDNRQVITPATLAFPPPAISTAPLNASPSMHSTDTLHDHSLATLMLSPMRHSSTLQHTSNNMGGPDPDMPQNAGDLFIKLSELLERGLANTAHKITNDIRSDFQNLGTRIEAIEQKLDFTVARANQNTDHIQVIQEQLDVALNRIDDLEN